MMFQTMTIQNLMALHIVGLVGGYFLDLFFGDPNISFHPIRLIGNMIAFLEKRLYLENGTPKKQKYRGTLLVIFTECMIAIITVLLMITAYAIHPSTGVIIEMVLTWFILAAKSLKLESMKVCDALEEGDLDKAREAVSMIVGRDTKDLSSTGVAKAAVETVAENTSDGVIAPLLYTALGGPILGYLYKGINTMDSMVGYKNDRYLYFGKTAAKIDDIVNFLPARISAGFMIISAFLLPKSLNGREAIRIFKRDRYNHASPNSAQTESVCAGALGVQLAGDASYFGKLIKKPYGNRSRV